MLYLGLDRAYDHLLHHDFVFSRDPHEEFDSIYRKGEPAPDPTCYLASTARTEPETAPPGGEALYVLVHTPYLRPHHDWKRMLPAYRRVILDKLKTTGQCRTSRAASCSNRRLTPQDIHDRYRVLNGAIYGLASHGKWTARSSRRTGRRDVAGLYLAGGAAHPGPGHADGADVRLDRGRRARPGRDRASSTSRPDQSRTRGESCPPASQPRTACRAMPARYLPHRWFWLLRLFRRYATPLRPQALPRGSAVDLRRGPSRCDGDEPILIVLNHPSWWDPMIGIMLSSLMRRSRPLRGDRRRAVERYSFFKTTRLRRGRYEDRSAARPSSSARGPRSCPSPNRVFWVTAQGASRDVRERAARHPVGRRPPRGAAEARDRAARGARVHVLDRADAGSARADRRTASQSTTIPGFRARNGPHGSKTALTRNLDVLNAEAMTPRPGEVHRSARRAGPASAGSTTPGGGSRRWLRGERFDAAHESPARRACRDPSSPGSPSAAPRSPPCSTCGTRSCSASRQRSTTSVRSRSPTISVLIPARNEELGIAACVESVLASRHVELEVIVLDDHSTDRTAEIVRAIAATRSARAAGSRAPPLPDGWCGKQHACFALSKLARHDVLTFLDADVRLEPDALARMRPLPEGKRGRARQRLPAAGDRTRSSKSCSSRSSTGCCLCFLPLWAMRQLPLVRVRGRLRAVVHDHARRLRAGRRARGGEVVAARRPDAAACLPPRRVHDRHLRRDQPGDVPHVPLGDARCGSGWRRTPARAWPQPGRFCSGPWCCSCGQVLPFSALLHGMLWADFEVWLIMLTTMLLNLTIQLLSLFRFQQSPGGALLFPLAILLLLAIQWYAIIRAIGASQWGGKGDPIRLRELFIMLPPRLLI